ncbi:MAG TPA: polysaccharide biosynthesis/export family protein [Candidatus Eremiobacteraceae bacterium]|nr:polysaccharide biosynthesis/export family protein [Candidatus Eremiobacteraceae bacterium]
MSVSKSASLLTALGFAAAMICGTAGVAQASPIGEVTPAPAAAPVAATSEYIIHANDQLNVQVFGDSTLSQSVTVLPSGDISYPLIGRVHVAGESPEAASKTIAAALKKYVRNPVVTVILAQQGEINVLVLGGVQHTGKYQLTSSARLTDAVAAAGGLEGTAQAYPTAKVTDYAGHLEEVSLQKLYGLGDTSQDVPVTDGSIVYIPSPETIDVEVSGAVDHPGEIEIAQGDKLSMAIAKAGNSDAADGDLNNITVTRTVASGQVQKFNVNLYDALQNGQTTADLTMQKGDVVFVPKSKHGINGNGQSNPLYLLLIGLRNLFPHI